jgi:hypothetical protein
MLARQDGPGSVDLETAVEAPFEVRCLSFDLEEDAACPPDCVICQRFSKAAEANKMRKAKTTGTFLQPCDACNASVIRRVVSDAYEYKKDMVVPCWCIGCRLGWWTLRFATWLQSKGQYVINTTCSEALKNAYKVQKNIPIPLSGSAVQWFKEQMECSAALRVPCPCGCAAPTWIAVIKHTGCAAPTWTRDPHGSRTLHLLLEPMQWTRQFNFGVILNLIGISQCLAAVPVYNILPFRQPCGIS